MSEHHATRADHRPEAIRRPLAEPHRHDYIADAVHGASARRSASSLRARGWARGQRLGTPRLRAARGTLWSGAAAVLAYIVGHGLGSAVGTT